MQTIERERDLLAELRAQAHVIDTSQLRTSQLQNHHQGTAGHAGRAADADFQSFGFQPACPWMPTTCSTCVCCPTPLRARAARTHRARCPGDGVLAAARRGGMMHRARRGAVSAALAAGAGAQKSPQLRHRGHWLQGAAPLGVPVRAVSAASSLRSGARWCATANSNRKKCAGSAVQNFFFIAVALIQQRL